MLAAQPSRSTEFLQKIPGSTACWKTGMRMTWMTKKRIRTERSSPTPPIRAGGMIFRIGLSTGSQMADSTRLSLKAGES